MNTPDTFRQLIEMDCIRQSDILSTKDGFTCVSKSLSDILSKKGVLDFPDSSGQILPCSSFFDDWFLYAVPEGDDCVYSLFKLREQEHDTEDGSPADGDTPGVTVCFISFSTRHLIHCLSEPASENRQALNAEINRVVARRGQQHHRRLKQYFIAPESEGAYLIAALYAKHIASFSSNGVLDVPEHYKEILQQSISYKNNAKFNRLPRFIASVNQQAGHVICDDEKIYIADIEHPDRYEIAAILATHTGNTSIYSFAAEVEYHARFLTALAKVKIPFFGKSIYDSAIRADMTVGDTEFEGPAPFHRPDSAIVRRQREIHENVQQYL